MSKIRVLIADDHAIVRDGLRQLLNGQPDMETAGEAGDGREAGLIREAAPDSQIVVLSMHAKETYVQQALAAGALGYVLKASPSQDILEAIRAARRGEYFLSSRLRAEVIGKYLKTRKNPPSLRGYDLLSEREQQVFRLVAQGHSTDQIADILCVSPKTVEKHRTSLMNKLGVHDRLELLKYAIKIGIVDPELWED